MKPKVFLGKDGIYISYSPCFLSDAELCVRESDINEAKDKARSIVKKLHYAGSKVKALQSVAHEYCVDFLNAVLFFLWATEEDIDEYLKMAKVVENWPSECEYDNSIPF